MFICIDRAAAPRHCMSAVFAALATLLLLAGCASTPSRHEAPSTTSTTSNSNQVTPNNSQAREQFQAAVKLMKAREDDKAIAAFKKLTTTAPQASGPYTNLGILYARANQWDKASTALKAATGRNAKNAVAWNWLGISERHLQHYPQALAAYKKVLEIQPDNADAHLNMAILYDLYMHVPGQAIAEYKAYQQTQGQNRPIVAAWIKGLSSDKPSPQPTEKKP